MLIFGSIVFLSYFYNLIEILSNVGSVGKIIKYQELIESEILINPRFKIWTHGLNFIFNNPMTIIFGIGYGDKISEAITGIAFYESSFLQIFIELGLLGFILLLSHFLIIFNFILKKLKTEDNISKLIIYKGYFYFLPGFVLANIFGGNMYQTDFIAPIFYGFLAICHHCEFKIEKSIRDN